MSTKDIERCLKTSIHLPKATWFSNQDLGTATLLKDEGKDGVIGSVIGDFEDSPLSDLVEEQVSFLLGAMKGVFEGLKKTDFTVYKFKKSWSGMGKGRFTSYLKVRKYIAFVLQ